MTFARVLISRPPLNQTDIGIVARNRQRRETSAREVRPRGSLNLIRAFPLRAVSNYAGV